MFRTLVMTFAITVIGLTQLTLAQAPGMGPATQPAGPVDQSTPQGTLILVTRTMQNGDVAGARQLLHAATPEEGVLAALFVQAVEVNARFRSAVSKVFGDGVADSFVGSAKDVEDAEKSIRSAKVDIENDTASVKAREGEDPVKLVRVDGKWKLSMGAIAADEMARTQQDLKIRLEVLDGIATEVAAGRFKSPDEMGNAIRTGVATAVLKAADQGSATRPASPAAPARGQ